MMLLTAILALGAFLCWLLFTLSVNALPFYVGLNAGIMSYQFGSGLIAATTVGSVASSATYAAARLVAVLPWPLARAAITLLFTAPAGFAGYHAAFGLANVGAINGGWRHVLAIAGAIAVSVVAALRMLHAAPPEAGQELAGVMSAHARGPSTDRRVPPRPRPDWRTSAR